MKEEGVIGDGFADVTVLSGDIVEFTKFSVGMSLEPLVVLLDELSIDFVRAEAYKRACQHAPDRLLSARPGWQMIRHKQGICAETEFGTNTNEKRG
jgi:hypothetical protein